MDGLRPAIWVPCGDPAGLRRVGRGDLDGFINAYLTQLATGELNKSSTHPSGCPALRSRNQIENQIRDVARGGPRATSR